MNLRQHKRMIVGKMHYIIINGRWERFINGVFERMDTAEDKARRQAELDKLWEELMPKLPSRHLNDPNGMLVIDDLSTTLTMSMFASKEDLAAAQNLQATSMPYVVLKVKDDSEVAAVDTKEEALALVQKHARQKKAKLYVTHAGEKVLFAEEETA